MKNIIETINKVFGGRGVDKRFPVLLWLFKRVFALLQKNIPMTVKTGYGGKLIVSGKDAGLGLVLRSNKAYEPLLTKYIQDKVKSGDNILDVGANVGYFTKLFSKMVGKRGKVIAFEPSKINLPYLEINVKRLANVLVAPVALGGEDGMIAFGEDKANPGENGFVKNSKKMVKVVKLDDWMKSRRLSRVNFVKIDVEGAEVMMLAGAKTILISQKNLVMACECHPKALGKLGYSVVDLKKAITSCGLKITQIIDERQGKVSRFTPQRLTKILANVTYVTLVAERRDE